MSIDEYSMNIDEYVLVVVVQNNRTCKVRVTSDSPKTFMSQRKSAMDEQKVDALHQYQDTDGHFSLVRRAVLRSVSNEC